MISLISIGKRFWTVMRSGWADPEFRGLSIILGSWLALGTIIYSVYEDWSVTESLYFCVMTLTTIGYGDFTPSDGTMQIYTVFYAVLGIGFFVAFNAQIVRIAIQSRQAQKAQDAPDAADD